MAIPATIVSVFRPGRGLPRPGLLLAAVLCVGLALLLVARPGNVKSTDYEIDLARLDKAIGELRDTAFAAPIDGDKVSRFAYLLYRRAALTASAADFDAAQQALNDAMQRVGPTPDLCFIKANIDFTLHRLPETKRDLEMIPELTASADVKALRADIALQEGHYETARNGYDAALRARRTWDNLVRMAYLTSITGDIGGADALYAEAESEITAKEMRSYAWLQLQQGYRALGAGRHEAALEHYERASRAYSGYWLVDEHIAELLAAQRKFDEAVAAYRKVIARRPSPELQQALGDLYLFMGKPSEAKPWHDKALAAYLASVRRGEVQYLHHLAGFYADVRQDGAEAVKWARKDLELRQSFVVHDAMGWAFYRDGRFAEALAEMREALAHGVKDAHLFFHAGMIHLAAGRTEEGKRLLRQAAEVNPHFEAFHVHR